MMASRPTPLDARAPPALRRLHALFSSVEFGLSSLALYQRTPDWETVKRAVESSSQTTLAKEDVQQILWLAPSAYSVAWSSRPPSRKRARAAGAADVDDRDPDEPQLLLRRQRLTPVGESPEASETLSERIEWFTKRLNAFIDEQVAQLSIQDDEDAAEALARSVVIGQTPFPEKEATSTHQQHHERLEEIAKKTARDVATSEQLAEALAAPVPEDLQTLPKWLIDKVRRQEQQSKRAAQRTDAAQKQRLYTTLPQLSDQIQSLALVQRRHVFPLAEMVKQLRTKAPVRDQIEEQIHLLESMVPFWLTVFFSDGKQFVKVSKSHKYNAVKAALRKALATMGTE